MSELYRFKFRSEWFDIELESTDQSFIDRKMMQLIELSAKQFDTEEIPRLLAPIEPAPSAEQPPAQPTAQPVSKNDQSASTRPRPATKTKVDSAPDAPPTKKRRRRKRKQVEGTESGFDAAKVAAAVKSSKFFPTIQKSILNRSNQLNRIMLCFYFVKEVYGPQALTTGDIESITAALGVRIRSTNVSSQIKKNADMFSTKEERKRGSVVHYELTKKGYEQIEKILQEDKK